MGEACVAVFWPTPSFNGRTFVSSVWVLSRGDLNFCVHSTWQQELLAEILQGCQLYTYNGAFYSRLKFCRLQLSQFLFCFLDRVAFIVDVQCWLKKERKKAHPCYIVFINIMYEAVAPAASTKAISITGQGGNNPCSLDKAQKSCSACISTAAECGWCLTEVGRLLQRFLLHVTVSWLFYF